MTERVRTYRLVTPPPWERISLREDPRGRIEEIVDDVAERFTPKEVPPDQVGPKKRQLVEAMMQQVAQARDNGGVDLYLPLSDLHGYSVQASFVVSEVTPNALLENDQVPDVLASLLADTGSSPVTIDDTIWVRKIKHEQPTDQVPVPSRRVEYLAAVPGAARFWIMVAFSAAGEPIADPRQPDGPDLLIELFDAMMSTWRWVLDTAEATADER